MLMTMPDAQRPSFLERSDVSQALSDAGKAFFSGFTAFNMDRFFDFGTTVGTDGIVTPTTVPGRFVKQLFGGSETLPPGIYKGAEQITDYLTSRVAEKVTNLIPGIKDGQLVELPEPLKIATSMSTLIPPDVGLTFGKIRVPVGKIANVKGLINPGTMTAAATILRSGATITKAGIEELWNRFKPQQSQYNNLPLAA